MRWRGTFRTPLEWPGTWPRSPVWSLGAARWTWQSLTSCSRRPRGCQRMESFGYHTEWGEGALGMPEGGAVKVGGLEMKEMQKIPAILNASLVRLSFTEYLDRGFEIRAEHLFFLVF
ncbi:uncharacterized protein LOC135096043 [Scylla paramamosain]|uniref:uncharacterized protein LOC135096043 n=1 Tax=Scylla paramamosain TaxID=85552 RepID=UPI003083761C